jgi:hypothetical protein
MSDMADLMNDANENKLIEKLKTTSLTFVSIFILIFFILMNFYLNNPTGETKFNMISLSDLMQLCINPCVYDSDPLYPCAIKDYLNTYCGDKSLEDLEFLQYSMFILRGAYLLCSTYNDSIINKIGSGVYSLSSTSKIPTQQTNGFKVVMIYAILYIIIFYLSQNIKSGIVNDYFMKYTRKIKFFRDLFKYTFFQSTLSIFMLVFTVLLLLNLVSYLSYLFWGALSSTTNNLMYIVMIILIPFVFWIADVKLTFIEGFREGAKNKSSSSKKSKKNKSCVTVKNYNYIVPIIIVFIIPILVTLKTFFSLIFTGLYSVPSILVATDSGEIQSRVGRTILYSFGALIFAFGLVIAEKVYDIVNK